MNNKYLTIGIILGLFLPLLKDNTMNGDYKQLFQLIYAILAVFTILFIMVLGIV